MGRNNKPDLVLESLEIEAVAAEGKSIAHAPDGRVVFVDYAVPGDVADVRILKRKKNYMEGRIETLVKPSEHRVVPFCSHFGVCGGCRWQHLPYSMQLEAKRSQVVDQLQRIGHLDVPEVRPTLGSKNTVYYRNKLEFTASPRRWILSGETSDNLSDEELCGLGFHVGKYFDKVLDIKECFLQGEPSNSLRIFVKQYAIQNGISFYNLRENHGQLRSMFVRTSSTGELMLIVCFGEDFDGRERMLSDIYEAFPQISSLYYIINKKLNDSISDQECILFKGSECIHETMEGLTFRIGPKSFYQTNSDQAYELYKVAREFAALNGGEVVYDLYTGTGTIAQFVSRKASRVIGIEYVPEAIEDAKTNARLNGIENCEFYAGDMKDVLTSSFIAAHGKPDVMIVDPPRAGMHPDVVKTILASAPERIVYVSCNPASQARDLQMMSSDYEIVAVQPVDMFPHTQHVENVCKLVRRPEKCE